jgi:predicted ATPase
MLKRIKIINFKSLENVEINFNQKFHAIIGRNNSGKTNLIEAIDFVSKLARKLELFNVIEKMGGFDRILYFEAKEKIIQFELEIVLEKNTYIYELAFSDKSILKEKLLLNNKIVLEILSQGKGRTFDYVENIYKDFSFESKNLALNQLWDYERYKPIREFSKILNKFEIYKLLPNMMRESSPAKKEFNPETYGEKIIQVLHSILSEDYQTYREIVEIMKTMFDEIQDIYSTIDERGLTNIEILEIGFEKKFDIKQISDGILRFLAFLTIIHLQKKFTLLCFEEPELYLHPSLLVKLIELLKNLEIQVIITTHSPQILNLLDPDDLIIVYKRDGNSAYEQLPTKLEVIQKLKQDGFLLGELWTMGEFDNA